MVAFSTRITDRRELAHGTAAEILEHPDAGIVMHPDDWRELSEHIIQTGDDLEKAFATRVVVSPSPLLFPRGEAIVCRCVWASPLDLSPLIECAACHGYGKAPGTINDPCDECNGSGEVAPVASECPTCAEPGEHKPSHEGSSACESGSIASGGTRAHCTCDRCW